MNVGCWCSKVVAKPMLLYGLEMLPEIPSTKLQKPAAAPGDDAIPDGDDQEKDEVLEELEAFQRLQTLKDALLSKDAEAWQLMSNMIALFCLPPQARASRFDFQAFITSMRPLMLWLGATWLCALS